MSRKSKPTVPPRREGTGRGYNSPAGGPCSAFTRWQTGHVRTKVSTSDALLGHHAAGHGHGLLTAKTPAQRGILGHQTMRRAMVMVFSRPRCPRNSVSASRRSSGSEGMHKRSPLALRRNRRPEPHKYEGCNGIVVKGTGCPRLATKLPASGRAAAARGPRTEYLSTAEARACVNDS